MAQPTNILIVRVNSLMVSCEDQKTADERIPLLLDTLAAVRWVSAEPLLGPLDLLTYVDADIPCFCGEVACGHEALNWVVIGGESGPGARECNIEWMRSIVGQCKAAGVPVFVKQLGADPIVRQSGSAADLVFPDGVPAGVSIEGGWASSATLTLKDRKGGDMSEWPEDLRVREMPEQIK